MEFDVIVIGASSAGLYLAEKLARAGQRVGIFEQRTAPLPARRTLIVTPHLERVLPNLPSSVVLNRVGKMVVASRTESRAVDLNPPDLIVERGALVETLAKRANAAGATIEYGYRFQCIEARPDGARVRLEGPGRRPTFISARAIVGADGVFSDVATAAGVAHAPTVPILQAEVRLPPAWDPNVTQVWFDTDETRFFYWLIPESDTHGVVGLAGDDRARMSPLLGRFLERQGLKPLAYQGARIAMHHPRLQPWAQIGAAPVLLVGDAAGQVKVTTVGGTVSGFLGAAAAARALLHGTRYSTELRAVKRELDLHWYIRALLDRLDNATYDRLVRAMSPRVCRFLSDHNRDEMAPAFWQLVLIQPRLIALALHSLRRSPARRLALGARQATPAE